MFLPFSIETSKCSGSCKNTNYPYAKICVPDVVKSLNVKVFNLECQERMKQDTLNGMKRANVSVNFGLMFVIINNIGIKTNADVNAKNGIDKGVCNKGFIWNPSNCKCECDKACDVGEYIDYENCKCRKKIVDKLVEECTEFQKWN